MLLAAILSLSMFCLRPAMVAAGVRAQSGQQPPAEVKPDSSPPSGQSNTDAQQAKPPAPKLNPASDSSAAAPKPTAAAKRKPQGTKKTAPCNTSAGTKTSSPASPSDPAAASSAPATGTPAPKLPPCAPAKVVIRNGGTGEAAIELTGGSAPPKDSPQRAQTNGLLGSTEEKLKKIDGQHLDSSQQETMKQAHQYEAQSRAALEEGNLERAYNLALKAHLLADQLLKPKP
jgi:hypothetical protein